jgi:DNA mismatch endonuclease (patch repair protein)
MPDKFSKEKRSEIMSKIRSTGTEIELKMKGALEENKIPSQYQPKMFGKPDFLICDKLVVFCDSSFWHGRNWGSLRLKLPKEYWYDHIKNNRTRDRKVNKMLRKKGFIVLRFWDEEIVKTINECIERIKDALREDCGN